jgi:hypothetical protein
MTEEQIGAAWAAMAWKEGHRSVMPPSPSVQEMRQHHGRMGAKVIVSRRKNATVSEVAMSRAMFLARHHAPVKSSDLTERYNLSADYARKTLGRLAKEKRIKQIGTAEDGSKLWIACD